MKKLCILAVISIFAFKVSAQTDTLKKVAVKQIYKVRTVGGTQMSSANDVMTNLSKSKNYTILVSLINAAGLSDMLKGKRSFTLLAPTDDAFKKVKSGFVDTLLKPEHLAELKMAINYLIISGKLTSADIAKQISAAHGEATLNTFSGSLLKARINIDRNIVLTDNNGNQAIISQFDIAQANGLLDVINNVLIPR
jgi:uncharacterized surface protein with fasciclin (FAS1) repeats